MSLIAESIHIWRDEDADYHFYWETREPDAPVEVSALGAQSPPLEHAAQPGLPYRARMRGLDPDRQYTFRLRDTRGVECIAGARGQGVQGGVNFRDFGGYPTRDGRVVRWGRLYRCGHLSTLTERGVQQLAALDLDLICDFRREDEQRFEPSRLPTGPTPRVLGLGITPGSQGSALYTDSGQIDGVAAMRAFMCGINQAFVRSQSVRYRELFAALLEDGIERVLVHCAAGKDRTGFAAAMILHALGVPEALIMGDYLLTRHYFTPRDELARVRAKYAIDHLSDEAVLPMLTVEADYLRSAYAAIKEDHGTVDRYLQEALGVGEAERAVLAARFLEG